MKTTLHLSPEKALEFISLLRVNSNLSERLKDLVAEHKSNPTDFTKLHTRHFRQVIRNNKARIKQIEGEQK